MSWRKRGFVSASQTVVLQGLKAHVDEDDVKEFISDAGIEKFMNAKVNADRCINTAILHIFFPCSSPESQVGG